MLQLAVVHFKKGAYIFVEGNEPGSRFYIIQSGSVVCSRTEDMNRISEKTLGPGNFLGVISCMTGHLQLENCMAVTDVRCIAVRRDQYSELIEQNVPVALKIVRSFAANVRAMNERLAKFALNNTGADTPEHIFDVAEYYGGQGRRAAAAYAYRRYLQECPEGARASVAERQLRLLCRGSGAEHLNPAEERSPSYPQGAMIFSESSRGSDMFVIQSGQVAITKVVDGSEIILAVLKKGDMFGEMALLEGKPRSACALAQTDCQLMAVNRKNFDILVSTQPQLVARLTAAL
ncbi:MAG: cyclic nucleotide-binding domain-containing protein, partial [Treponemataceae bacterium]|nr:cyclic nucleotide-binding domain-containing protein [Treponemataceae bacterium]